MKRWDRKSKEMLDVPDVDAFLADVVAVCERHRMSLGHEDRHGAFEVYRSVEPDAIRWLMDAHVAKFEEDE